MRKSNLTIKGFVLGILLVAGLALTSGCPKKTAPTTVGETTTPIEKTETEAEEFDVDVLDVDVLMVEAGDEAASATTGEDFQFSTDATTGSEVIIIDQRDGTTGGEAAPAPAGTTGDDAPVEIEVMEEETQTSMNQTSPSFFFDV